MANKQRTTFQKRQKELARQDKQRKKVERRAQRKLEKAQTQRGSGPPVEELITATPEVGPD